MGYNFFNIKNVKESFNRKLKDFVLSLGKAIGNGEDIPFADNDVTYTLKLQHERIKDKGLEMEYEVYSRDPERNDFIAGSNWRDRHYESVVCFRQCGVKRRVKRNGKKIYRDNQKCVLYEVMTDVVTGEHPDNDTFCCPNCGAATTIAELQNGCSYCGTRYKMDDLFPKVTGYYFLDDVGMAGNEGKAGIFLSIFGGMLLVVGIGVLFNLKKIMAGDIETLLGLLCAGPFLGGFMGYFMFGMFLLIRMIAKAIATSGKMGTAGSRRKFENRMKKLSPEFSFEYFTNKAISLIKTAVYSKNPQELLFYEGEPLDPRMKDIIDLNYGGALGLEYFEEKDGIATVVVDAYFDVLYATDRGVKYKHQVFSALLRRRTDIPFNYNFSMTRIACPTCGSSFDATKNRICPNCGNPYEMISDDWVLSKIKIK